MHAGPEPAKLIAQLSLLLFSVGFTIDLVQSSLISNLPSFVDANGTYTSTEGPKVCPFPKGNQ